MKNSLGNLRMGGTGPAHQADFSKETAFLQSDGAHCGADAGRDSDLSFVVERWPLLSDSVRNEICRLAAAE
jgi:hypothetical protein